MALMDITAVTLSSKVTQEWDLKLVKPAPKKGKGGKKDHEGKKN